MRLPGQATAPVAVAALLLAIMGLHLATIRNVMAVGEVQSEVTHRIFALPVFLVLLWQSRSALHWPHVTPSAVGVALLMLFGLSWAVGEITYIRALSELAVIAMIPAAVLALFGWTWLSVLLFPLTFLLFAVPLRGPLVDWQVALTADFVHAALRASGVPVYRDGAFFELPGRSWSVADECSGVEYLSACLMFAALFAWTFYASNRKRAWFVFGAVILGLAGNWLRAYLTIALAHFSGNRLFAQGHGTFGWIFFACLLALFCWVGWRFRDSTLAAAPPSATAVNSVTGFLSWRGRFLGFLSLAALLAWPLALSTLAPAAQKSADPILAPALDAWNFRQVESSCVWQPQLRNPSWMRTFCYVPEGSGSALHLVLGGFVQQSWNAKLVTSVHEIAPQGWSMTQRGGFSVPTMTRPLAGRAFLVRKSGERYRVWQWYALHGEFTGSDTTAKWLQLKARLGGAPDQGYWIAVAVRVEKDVEAADEALRAFVTALADPLARRLFS